MMAIARRDDWLTDAQGRALAGAQVYYCNQPATVTSLPPSPLATVYADLVGDSATNPQITDGFGHAIAYLEDSVLYTIVYVHPLFGPDPAYNNQPVVVLKDQSLGGGGGGGSNFLPFEGVPAGTINGTNTVFTLTNAGTPLTVSPVQVEVVLNMPLIPGLGYTLLGNTVIYANAPQPASGATAADAIYARGWIPA